jgi:hypothetical protein
MIDNAANNVNVPTPTSLNSKVFKILCQKLGAVDTMSLLILDTQEMRLSPDNVRYQCLIRRNMFPVF